MILLSTTCAGKRTAPEKEKKPGKSPARGRGGESRRMGNEAEQKKKGLRESVEGGERFLRRKKAGKKKRGFYEGSTEKKNRRSDGKKGRGPSFLSTKGGGVD